MKIDMEFKGLEELVKAFESAASDEDIAQVNKTIAEKGEPVVQRIMSGKIPKSKDIKKSGRGFGSKSSVSAHAADEIPIGKVKVFQSALPRGERHQFSPKSSLLS